MNKDIRLNVFFFKHRKTLKLRRKLGAEGVLALMTLWTEAAINRPDGILTGYDEEDIAIASGWPGEPEELVTALLECGFLERLEDGTYKIHDWEEHQPWAVGAKERSEQARKAALARWNKYKAEKNNSKHTEQCAEHADLCSAHAECMQGAYGEHADRNARFVSSPFLSSPFVSSRNEKEKEKENLTPLTGCLSETAVSDSSPKETQSVSEEQKDFSMQEPLREEKTQPLKALSEKERVENKGRAAKADKSGQKKHNLPPCPHEEIVRLYEDKLPQLPRVRSLGEQRRRFLRARWREVFTDEKVWSVFLESPPQTVDDGIYWFSRFFDLVGDCPFLLGDNRKGWQADFEWLIRPSNFAKVLEGRYLPAEQRDSPYSDIDRWYERSRSRNKQEDENTIDADFFGLTEGGRRWAAV